MSSINIHEEEKNWMIRIEDVVHVKWTKERAINLKQLREKKNISLRILAEKVKEKGQKCTYTSIHTLEIPGKIQYTTLKFIIAICEAINEDIRILYPMISLNEQK